MALDSRCAAITNTDLQTVVLYLWETCDTELRRWTSYNAFVYNTAPVYGDAWYRAELDTDNRCKALKIAIIYTPNTFNDLVKKAVIKVKVMKGYVQVILVEEISIPAVLCEIITSYL